jgi:hypothetical protein
MKKISSTEYVECAECVMTGMCDDTIRDEYVHVDSDTSLYGMNKDAK